MPRLMAHLAISINPSGPNYGFSICVTDWTTRSNECPRRNGTQSEFRGAIRSNRDTRGRCGMALMSQKILAHSYLVYSARLLVLERLSQLTPSTPGLLQPRAPSSGVPALAGCTSRVVSLGYPPLGYPFPRPVPTP